MTTGWSISSHRDDAGSLKAECQTMRSICLGCHELTCEPTLHLHVKLGNGNSAIGVCSEGCAMIVLARYGITAMEGVTA